MTRSSSSGAGGRSVITGTTFSSLVIHPQSLSFILQTTNHCCTCRYTRNIRYLAAAEVGGKVWGRICNLLVATLSQNVAYPRPSRLSPSYPLYIHTSDTSPASMMSSTVRPSCRTLQPYLWKMHWRWISSATIFFRDHKIVCMWCHTPISRVWTGCYCRCHHPAHFGWLWYPRCGSSSLSLCRTLHEQFEAIWICVVA